MKTVQEVRELLNSEDAPDEMVAYEFSGALLEARRATGASVMSVDRRAPEHDGWHYQGDLRDIIALRVWLVIFFVGPPCFQHMERDDCLEAKIDDMRAFWAGVTVWWCVTCPYALSVLVEQPNTIGHRFVDAGRLEGVQVHHLRTGKYGDTPDKYVRLTTRNLSIESPPYPDAPAVPKGERPLSLYKDADERDRAKSSWRPFVKMCASLARARPIKFKLGVGPSYADVMEEFALNWHRAGYPVPHDYQNTDAQPSSVEERRYQQERGAGRGWRGPTTIPELARRATPEEDERARRQHRFAVTDLASNAERGTQALAAVQKARALFAAEQSAQWHDRKLQASGGPLGAPMEAAPAVELPPRATALVVLEPLPGGAVIYAPNDSSQVHVVSEVAAGKTGVVAAAESLVRRRVAGIKKLFGYRAGTTEEKQKLVVVAVEREEDNQPREAGEGSIAPTGCKAAVWCALATLACTPLGLFAELAAVSASHYRTHDGSTTTLLQSELTLRELTGMRPGGSPMMAPKWPVLSQGEGVTPRQLVQFGVDSLPLLRHDLVNDGGPLAEYYAGWADSIQPLAIADVPSELLDKPLYLNDGRLQGELFSEPLPVYETPWLARQQEQQWRERPGCQDFRPRSVLDLVDGDAIDTMKGWFDKEVKDLACLEEYGPNCDRKDKPGEVAIGQDQFSYCARGYFWDCRGGKGCSLLRYDEPLETDFNIKEGSFLQVKLQDYPDQRLASNVLEGIRLEADLEMQIVLSPQLISIGEGYDSVQKTVRELKSMGFYDFFHDLPFAPIFIVSQGSRIKKLGVKKYRRTSNFSAPHKSVRDKAGVEVVPVNTASRCYLVPVWLAEHSDPAVRAWLQQKYEHVPATEAQEQGAEEHTDRLAGASPRYKFPKEYKPQLGDLMRDMTLLLQAAMELGEAIFVWVEDAAFYFNQFAYAPEELWKSNLIVSARLEDLDSDKREFDPGALVFVSERRLGFGSYASSNIAQRFSNAVVGWTIEEFYRLEEAALDRDSNDPWHAWRARRERLEPKCRAQRPKRRGRALSDCTQTRLGVLKMYTDDPAAVVVGRERLKRMLAAWRAVTTEINLVMAGPDGVRKRQLGAHIEWIGILLLAGIGLVVVPQNKLVRAREALVRAVAGEMTFGEYRALMGLLEHLRFIAQLAAETTNGLYRPHGAHGESREGPSTRVRPDEMMMEKLKAWIDIVMNCAGALVTLAFAAGAAERLRAALSIFAGSADAAGDGEGEPGFGGYLHGFIWRVKLPANILKLMHITAWETLATAVNALVANRLSGPEAMLSLRGDALLIPYALSKQRSRSQHVQLILHKLFANPSWAEIAQRLVAQHLSGDLNVPSDAVSRALWNKLEAICQVLRTKVTALRLTAGERLLVTEVVRSAAQAAGQEVTSTDLHEMFDCALPHTHPVTQAGYGSASGASSGWTSGGGDEESQRRPIVRRRSLGANEQMRGKKRRNTSDGDGPRSKFQPPWLEDDQQPPPKLPPPPPPSPHPRLARPPSLRLPRSRSKFNPPWSARAERSEEATSAMARTHPYLRPAYNQSRLRPDQEDHAKALALRLHKDKSAGRIDAPLEELEEMAMAVAEAKADGVNPRTASKDSFALREFEHFAKLRKFDPNLRTQWVRKFPEREKLKLASFLLFRAQRAKPRSKRDKVAKPMSIYQNYLALARVFRQREVELPPAASVRETLRGLIKRAVRRFGIEWLRKKQVEPVTPPIIEKAINIAVAGRQVLLGVTWSLSIWTCFIVTAWMVINLVVGSRKGESTKASFRAMLTTTTGSRARPPRTSSATRRSQTRHASSC